MLVSADNPKPKLPSAAAMKDLPFLNAVIHESLRCFPPVAVGVGRMLDRDMELPDIGVTVPKGVGVGFSIWAMHYDTQLWGPDAGSWRPERWREGKSFAAVKKDARGHMKWVPFALGPQSCIGQHLALVCSELLQRALACDAAQIPQSCAAVSKGRAPCSGSTSAALSAARQQ